MYKCLLPQVIRFFVSNKIFLRALWIRGTFWNFFGTFGNPYGNRLLYLHKCSGWLIHYNEKVSHLVRKVGSTVYYTYIYV